MNFIFFCMIFISTGEPWARKPEAAEWQFSEKIHFCAWIVFVFATSLDGAYRLQSATHFTWADSFSVIKIASLPLSLFKPLRKWLWLALLVIGAAEFILCKNTGFEFLGLVLMLLFAFDSRWLPPKKTEDEESVLFFDGVCSLCSGFIDFMFKEDQAQVYKVAALQGKTAAKLLPANRIADLNTLVVLENGKEKTKSEAVLTIFDHIGGIWRVISFGRILPLSLRNKLYDLVASSRYKMFGKKSSCRIPTPEEKALFLD